ncbi:MAG TPA: PASTA domain-containing protein [Thermoanaerobaculia bacterium]|nr:PASTA domain-containing protein [Thermoanaerobaculia bacterium]
MPVIFISYRREDSAGHAGRLFDRLRDHFGKDSVFLDVVGIDAGVDFVETIDQAVGSCDVLLAVIGREWLTCCDKQKQRRLDDPNDFIRVEISSALKRNVRVVPVLVEGAEMPPTEALPEDLQRLTRRQAVELRDSRWDADVAALIAALERDAARTGAGSPLPAPPPARSGPVEPEVGRKPGRKALLWGIAALALALLVAAGVAVSIWPPEKQEPLVAGGSQKSGETTGAPAQNGQPPEPEPQPEPQTIKAPNLVGLPLQDAIDQLREAGLVVGDQETRQTGAAPARQVLSQWPRPGKELDRGSPVDLVYAEPLPVDPRIAVPDVIGAHYREALKTLQDVGFEVTRQTEPSQAAQYTVLRQEPAAGSRVEKGTKISLVYAVPIESPPPDRAGQTVVSIWYNDEGERPMAEKLAAALGDLRLRGVAFRVSPAKPGRPAGKLFYASRDQARMAREIASRSGDFLGKSTGRRVSIQMNLDPDVAGSGLVLILPEL